MKKILFYCDTVFGVGGVQRVLAEVAKRLSEEYEVSVSHLCSGQYLAAFATEVL